MARFRTDPVFVPIALVMVVEGGRVAASLLQIQLPV